MKQNVGILDTALRSLVAVILLAIAAEGLFSLPINVVLAVAGLAIWISCSFGVCLLYKALGIDTYPNGGHGLNQH